VLIMFGDRDGDARSGTIIGALWLIGIGAVFLVQQWIDRPWGEAWPLFVIGTGLVSLATLPFKPRDASGLFVSSGWSLLVTAIGVLLLLSTTGAMGVEPATLIGRGWPVAVIVLGVWFLLAAAIPSRAGSTERLALPLGDASRASVRIRHGGGELTVGRAAAGLLVDGEFGGGVVQHVRGAGSVELRPPAVWGAPWSRAWPRWEMGVTGEVPLELDIEGGASRTRLDLGELQVRSLRLQTGASETRVDLPRSGGETKVRAEAGAASLSFEVPAGVAVRIRSRMALGSTVVDARIPRSSDGWESPGYAEAENRVDLDLSGGVGQLRVSLSG
jgi:hypothetical protein